MSWSRRGARSLVLLLGACVVLVALAPAAGAHAVLVSSDPAEGALVDSPPSQIVLLFNEGVEATDEAVGLLDPSGVEVPGITSAAADATIRAELPSLDEDGSYTVTWEIGRASCRERV